MKKLFFAMMAVVAIASCAKTEVAPIANQDQEITFQTVQTKAATAFDEDNIFTTYAWFLPKTKNWASNSGDSDAYISNQTVSYNSTANAWKTATPYYWPKQGSLTFFSWTVNTDTAPAISGATVSCTNTDGITVDSYDITHNQNVDFLVADMAADQTANTTTVGTWKTGVPTVFRHAMTKLQFNVVTVDAVGTPHDYSTEGVSFTLKSIALEGVNNKKSYAQGIANPSAHTWTDAATPVEIASLPVYTNATGFTVTSTEQTLTPAASDYYIVLPQEMEADDLLRIQYEITTDFTGTPVTEEVELTAELKDVYVNGWDPTKNIILTIKFSVNEIFWAPTVEEWAAGSSVSTQF